MKVESIRSGLFAMLTVLAVTITSNINASTYDWSERNGWEWKERRPSESESYYIDNWASSSKSKEWPIVLVAGVNDPVFELTVFVEFDHFDGTTTKKEIISGTVSGWFLIRIKQVAEGKLVKRARISYNPWGGNRKSCTSMTAVEDHVVYRRSKIEGDLVSHGCTTGTKKTMGVNDWAFEDYGVLVNRKSSLSVDSNNIWAIDEYNDLNKVDRSTYGITEHFNTTATNVETTSENQPIFTKYKSHSTPSILKAYYDGEWINYLDFLETPSNFDPIMFTGSEHFDNHYMLDLEGELHVVDDGVVKTPTYTESSPTPTLEHIAYSEITGSSMLWGISDEGKIYEFSSWINMGRELAKWHERFEGVTGFTDLDVTAAGNLVGIKDGEMWVLKVDSGSVTKRNREIWMSDSPFTDIAVSPDGIVYTMDESYTIWEYTGNSTWDYVKRLNIGD